MQIFQRERHRTAERQLLDQLDEVIDDAELQPRIAGGLDRHPTHCRVAAEQLGDLGSPRLRAGPAAERLRQWAERPRPLDFVGAADEDVEAALACALEGRLEEPALPDPRLTFDEHDLHAPGGGALEVSLDQLQLPESTVQCRRPDRLRHATILDPSASCGLARLPHHLGQHT